MTLMEFDKIAKELNKKENCIFNGQYASSFKKGDTILTIKDEGCIVITKGDKKYVKDFSNNIVEENI